MEGHQAFSCLQFFWAQHKSICTDTNQNTHATPHTKKQAKTGRHTRTQANTRAHTHTHSRTHACTNTHTHVYTNTHRQTHLVPDNAECLIQPHIHHVLKHGTFYTHTFCKTPIVNLHVCVRVFLRLCFCTLYRGYTHKRTYARTRTRTATLAVKHLVLILSFGNKACARKNVAKST
jgi:hypothetical protein